MGSRRLFKHDIVPSGETRWTDWTAAGDLIRATFRPDPGNAWRGSQIVFIDSRVADLQTLVDGATPGTHVFVIDGADGDGLAQIAATLAANHVAGAAGIAIVSHGSAGELAIGATILNDATLADHADALTAIGAALRPDGDLSLYGCDVAAGAAGQTFIADLAAITGADVAAASHDVGSADRGADWTLDAATGTIESPLPFTAAALAQYDGALAGTITGQLWFGIAATPPIVGHVNSDGSSPAHTGDEAGAGEISPSTIGLDLAAGYYFQTNAADFVGPSPVTISAYRISDSSLVNTVNIGSAAAIDQVNALLVDPLNHVVYVGRWGVDLAHSGIIKVNYDPATGQLDSTAAFNGSPNFITHSTATDNDIRSFSIDLVAQKLYYSSNNNGYSTTPFSPSNGIYVVSTAGGSPTMLTTAAQFPAASQAGNIGPVCVDTAKGLIYFETSNFSTGLATLWYMPITGGTATAVSLPGGTVLAYGDFPQGGLSLDAQTQQLYITVQDNGVGAGQTAPNHVLVGQLSVDGHSITSFVQTFPFATLDGAAAQPGWHVVGTAFDQLPVLNTTGTTTHAAEQGGSVALLATESSSDTDGNHYSGATVQITGGTFATGETSASDDHLIINGATSGTVAGTSITFSYNSATETLTLSGYDTIAHYDAALALVKYNSTGDNPTNYGANTTRTVTWTVSDGALNIPVGQQNSATSSLIIDAVNDAPVNVVGSAASATEDGSNFAITGLSVSDVDANPATQSITVTLSVAHGTLHVSTAVGGGLVAGGVSGNDSATVTLTGTQNAINATLAGASAVTYAPTANYNGADPLTITTNDGGFNGTGGAQSDFDAKTINITPANDAPTVVNGTTQASAGISEDQPLAGGESISSLFGSHFSDSTDQQQSGGNPTGTVANSLAGIAVTFNGSSAGTGQWEYSTNGGGSWQTIGSASDAGAHLFNAATLLRFNPALNYNGPEPILTVHLIDSSGAAITDNNVTNLTGLFGGTNRYSSGTVDLGGNITAVDDAPVNAVPATQTINEDSTLTFTGPNAISVSDVDVGAGTLTVTLSVAHGTLSLSGIAGLAFGTGDGTADASMTFTGTVAAINTALNGLVYAPTADYNGSDTLTVTTNDNGNTGTPGALQDVDTVEITVTAVNDTPVVAYAANLASTEQVPAVIDAAASIHDVDLDARNGGSGDYGGATLSVVRQGGANADDIFSFASSGLFTVSGGNLQAGGQTFATVTNAGGTITISFTDSGTIATTALVNAVAQAIRYDNNNDSPPASIDLTISLDDGAPANAGQGPVAGHPAIGTDTVHVTITDTAENTPPVVDLNGVAAGIDDVNNYQEQGVDAGLGSAITVSDAENDNITGATVALSDFQTGDEFIVHLPLPTGISVLSNVNGFLTLTGTATAAAYQTALGQIGYQSTSDDPTAGGHGTRSIGVTVSDAFGTSAPATMTITVFGVNDEPTLSATAVNPTFTENGAAADLFSAPAASTVESGQTLTSLTLTVSNLTDGASEILSIDGSSVALTNGNSIVTATHSLTVNVALAGGTATVSFTGASLSTAALQTLVDTLAYSNSSDNPTVADRVVTLTQLVDSGSNVTPDDNVAALAISSTVHVVPVNDAALITGAITGSVTEAGGVNNGTPGTPTATGNLDDTDIDNPADTWQQVAAGAATANGYGSYGLGTDGQWTYTLNDNNAAVQALNGAATLTDTFVAKTADGTQQTVTITIHAQDDAAVAHNDAVSTTEAAVLSGSVIANNGSGADSDPDGPGLSVIAVNGNAGDIGAQITLASGAHLTLNANGTFSYDPNHAFDATPAPGSGASNTPALDSFTYTLSGGSMATVTVSVAGLDTNDVLRDGPGPATLQGGLGDDWYFVDQSSDVVIEHTGEGTDRVFASVSYALGASSEVELLTTAANDGTAAIDLTGSDTANFIYGNDGTNTLQGGAGDDFLAARAGDDILDGGTGNDIMAGESGNDWYFVDSPGDVIIEFAGAGNDRVFASVSYALAAQVDVETLTTTDNFGTAAIDLTGSSSANFIYGNDGANKLFGGAGDDVLASRAGNDTLDGGTGADTMIGGTGNDFYFVDQAGDVVVENPGEGDDRVFAAVSYTLAADAEVETLTTTANDGTGAIDLTGSNSANFIYGNDGANVLHGLGGDDFLASRAGNDMLDGGTGNDMLNGGAGADTFAFTTALGPNNVDTITDFASGTDKIALDHGIFGLSAGPLNAGAFVTGTQAGDADDRIIYDSVTGNLYFDADGSGAGAAVLFAHVDAGTTITASDFTVI